MTSTCALIYNRLLINISGYVILVDQICRLVLVVLVDQDVILIDWNVVLVDQNVVLIDWNVVLIDQNIDLADQNDVLVDQKVVPVDQTVVLVDQKPSGGGKSGESS